MKIGRGCLLAFFPPRLPTASQLTATARWKTRTCASSPNPSKFKPDAPTFYFNAQPMKTPRPPQSTTRARCPRSCAGKTVEMHAGKGACVSNWRGYWGSLEDTSMCLWRVRRHRGPRSRVMNAKGVQQELSPAAAAATTTTTTTTAGNTPA